jgi:hypothetical protein
MIYKTIIIYVSIIFLETISSFTFLTLNDLFDSYSAEFIFYNSLRVPIAWNLFRMFFYYPLLLVCFFFTFKYFNKITIDYKPILFSAFDLLVYVILNFLFMSLDLPSFEFNHILFWITNMSVFISPLILGQIPYFRRLMESF